MAELVIQTKNYDFGPAGGGVQALQEPEGVAAYSQAQMNSWYRAAGEWQMPLGNMLARRVADPWSTLIFTVKDPKNANVIDERLAVQISNAPLVALDTPLGKAFDQLGKTDAQRGIEFFDAFNSSVPPNSDAFPEWMLRALTDAHRARPRTSPPWIASPGKSWRDRVEGLAGAMTQRAQDLIDEQSERFSSLNRQIESEWTASKLSMSEQTRLEAPARLWAGRARTHGRQAKSARRQLFWTGAIGTAGAAGWAIAAYYLSRWIFAGAVAQLPHVPNAATKLIQRAQIEAVVKSISQPTLNPTFHFELIFTAAATLLYLTVFLWWMRILVRSYTTEQHLQIDASSRSAMTTTYLGLIRDQAASQTDRAIILASLFRPVTDGMVKDEGPPTLTPAAIASGVLSGKSGGAS